MNNLFDAFISYGRADSKAFATKLHVRLLEQGLKIWFDQNDIPLGVDFQNQIDDGIEKAHNFLFLIAPHSVNSPYCRKEIELALKRNKRIIPLLHVEQITWETWQQRFPQGTAEEWEAYKDKGLHSSFPNMHPAIGKINWVYFREGIDDFEQSFAGLIDLFHRQADYVEQHTQFLAKALEWERHQKQTSYLLIGEERQRAESWIKIHFKDEQAPCTPTDLHCEYITESIKNANNLMTQVFLSYADEDKETMEKIRNSLRRESITVWTNKTDIQTGEAFEEAINRGIEQADNLVFLLSPDSVNSRYCQQELDLVLSLNKRIIPVLVRETDSNQIPNGLRSLQYIDLTDNVKEDDYLLDESQLLKILHEDAAYYNEHKVLLTKALKWKRQHENPSILLRGYNLRSAEAWLKVAKKRTQHPPTPLQEEFIAESLRQPPASSLDVFVSYSRADSDFARKLNDSLQIQGKTTWFDQESIASGSDFQQEIYRGIKACDNFLFILSPRSVNSPYCADEVEYAASLNKRFVTVLHREVNASDLHPELAKVQWIDFNHNERDFNANFNQLVRTLDTDREHVHNHTKWLQRTIEWAQKGKSEDLLLRGNEYVIAQNWLQEAEQKNKRPSATPLQREFLLESGNAIASQVKKEKRQVIILRLMLGFIGLVAVVAGFSAWQAYQQKQNAEQAQKKAEQRLIDQVNALSRYSKTLTDSNQEFDALIEGIRAGNSLLEQNFWRKDAGQSGYQVEEALQKAIDGVKELNRIEGQTDVSASPDNRTIATITKDGKVRLWDFQGKERKPLSHDGEEITQISFTQDGSKIATVSGVGDKRTIKLWDSQGKLIQAFPPIDKFDYMYYLIPNDKLIATASWEGYNMTIKLRKIEGKQLTRLLSNEKFNDVRFSKDGNKIATVSGEGDKRTIKLWNSQGQLIQSFPPIDKFNYMYFSPNGKLIVTTSSDGDKQTVKLWRIEGKQLTRLLPNEKFNDIDFKKDGSTIATVSGEGDKWTIKLWNTQGKLIQSFPSIDKFGYMSFSPNGKLIVTTSSDGDKQTIKFWKIEGKQLKHLLPDEKLNDYSFSKDGNQIATISNNDIKLWTQDGEELQTLHIDTVVDSVYLSSEGKTIATVSSDKTVKFWNIDSSERKILKGRDAEFHKIKLSPKDSKLVATTYSGEGDNRTAKLWQVEDKQPQPLFSKEKFNNVSFIADGRLIATIHGTKGENQSVKLWTIEGKQLQSLSFNQKFNNISFSNDGKLMATYLGEGEKRMANLWRVEGKQPQPLLPNEKFNNVSFSNDGKLIATYSGKEDNQTAKLWQVEDKQPQPLLSNKTFNSISFSPDGKLIATYNGKEDKQTTQLWTMKGKQLQPFLSNEKFNNVRFSNDNKLIATYSGKEDNQTIKLWILKGKQPQRILPNETFNDIYFSDDGKLIATFRKGSDNQRGNSGISNNQDTNHGNSDNKTVKLWTRDGKELASFPADEKIDYLKFSPDGKLIATLNWSYGNNTVKFWNLTEDKLKLLGKEVRLDPNSYSIDAEFSPDSQLIATVNNNKVIQVWNRDGKELANLEFNESIKQMSFSPDSNKLAISSQNKAPILWYLKRDDWERQSKAKLNELVNQACKKVRNYLKNKPEKDSDRKLCDGISTQK